MNTTESDLTLFKPSQWLAEKIALALFPGGMYIGYWGSFCVVEGHSSDRPEDPAAHWITVTEDGDAPEDDDETFSLTLLDLVRGLERMIQSDGAGARRHAGWVLAENGDGDTQDLLVQYACFGEARYG